MIISGYKVDVTIPVFVCVLDKEIIFEMDKRDCWSYFPKIYNLNSDKCLFFAYSDCGLSFHFELPSDG